MNGAKLMPIRCRSRWWQLGNPWAIARQRPFLRTVQEAQHRRGVKRTEPDFSKKQCGDGFCSAITANDQWRTLSIFHLPILLGVGRKKWQFMCAIDRPSPCENPLGWHLFSEILADDRCTAIEHGFATYIQTKARAGDQRGNFLVILRQKRCCSRHAEWIVRGGKFSIEHAQQIVIHRKHKHRRRCMFTKMRHRARARGIHVPVPLVHPKIQL